MHIISRKMLREAEKKHSDLVGSLGTWFKVAKKAHWKNVEDVRKTHHDTNPLGPYTVFNIKGNAYRLIVEIEYRFELIFIKRVQTYAEYDEGDWGR